MNTKAPPRESTGPGSPQETRPVKLLLTAAEKTDRLELAAKQDCLAVPLPDSSLPVNFEAWQREARRLLREYRKTENPRHYRALLSHTASIGVRIAMVAAAGGNDGGSLDLLTDTDSQDDSRHCCGCNTVVTNDNLGGHSGHSALTGDLWCLGCADGRAGAQ